AISAVIVVRWRGQWQECDSPAGVNGRDGPHVGATTALGRIAIPSVTPKLTGLRDGMETPNEFAGQRIEAANIAVGTLWLAIGNNGTADDAVLVDRGRRSHPVASSEAALIVRINHAVTQIDKPAFAETVDWFTRSGIDRPELAIERPKKQSLVIAVAPERGS